MKLNLDVVPRNLDEAVDLLIKALEPDDHVFIEQSSEIDVHFSLGMNIRNMWSLWQVEMPLATWFRETLGLGHADDTSSIILQSFWSKVKNEPFDLQKKVDHYKAYWYKQGINAKTMERILI